VRDRCAEPSHPLTVTTMWSTPPTLLHQQRVCHAIISATIQTFRYKHTFNRYQVLPRHYTTIHARVPIATPRSPLAVTTGPSSAPPPSPRRAAFTAPMPRGLSLRDETAAKMTPECRTISDLPLPFHHMLHVCSTTVCRRPSPPNTIRQLS